MTETFELKADPRSDLGKGASRRLRRAGKVPAILYGGGQESLPLLLDQMDLINQMQNEAIYSHILTLNIDGRTESAVLRDIQRHPFKPTLVHLDFLRVSADRKLRAHIPLHFLNESASKGVKQQGGVVSHALIDIEISCLPKDLPEFIEVDLADLGMGETIHLSQVLLPPGVELANHIAPGSEHDAIVASIHHGHGGEDVSSDTSTPPAA